MSTLYDVTVEKYRIVVYDNGHAESFRNEESWSAGNEMMIGNSLVLALVARISELEKLLEQKEKESEK